MGFTAAVVAYNAIAAIQEAVESEHQQQLNDENLELSTFHIAVEVIAGHEGLVVTVDEKIWEETAERPPARLIKELRRVAKPVEPKILKKHSRGPKEKVGRG